MPPKEKDNRIKHLITRDEFNKLTEEEKEKVKKVDLFPAGYVVYRTAKELKNRLKRKMKRALEKRLGKKLKQ